MEWRQAPLGAREWGKTGGPPQKSRLEKTKAWHSSRERAGWIQEVVKRVRNNRADAQVSAS